MDFSKLLGLLPSLPTIVSEVTHGLAAISSQTQPSDLVRAVQQILNIVAPPSPPLVEDGWLGPKTKQALLAALMRIGIN